jgi:hypothetical protein
MSIADQKGQIKELQKLNKKAGGQLAQSRKVTQLHEFLLEKALALKQAQKQSLFFSIAAAINAVAKTKLNYLKKNPEAIAESFWSLLERRMLGVDGDGVRLAKTKRGTTWLGAWGRKNGVEDLQALVQFAESIGFDVDVISILGAMFAAVEMTPAIAVVLEKLIKTSCLIDRQIFLIEQAETASSSSSSSSSCSSSSDDEQSEGNAEKKEIPTTAPAEEEDGTSSSSSSESSAEEDAASVDGYEVNEEEAEKKSPEEQAYEKLIDVHGQVCELFFAELMKDELFLEDVTETMKKRRAEAKAAVAATKKRKAGETGVSSPDKEARVSSEEDDDEISSV